MTVMDKLAQLTKEMAQESRKTQRHDDLMAQLEQNRQAIEVTMLALIRFLDGKVSKTEVVNQLEKIRTPDALQLIPHINKVEAQLKLHKNTDLTPVTAVMKAVLKEVKAIPKAHPKLDKIEPINYKQEFGKFIQVLTNIESLIDSQNAKVIEPPVVNVPAPEVHVHTDLTDLLDKMDTQVAAIKDTKLPVKNDAVQTQSVTGLVTEKFDHFKVIYNKPDDFSVGKPQHTIKAVKYYLKGKLVATLLAEHDKHGNVTSVKKVTK